MDLLTWPWLAHIGLAPGLGWFDPAAHAIGRQVLQRGVAAIFFVAFLSTFNQFRALLGENGLLPVPEFLRVTRAWLRTRHDAEARRSASRAQAPTTRRRAGHLDGRPADDSDRDTPSGDRPRGRRASTSSGTETIPHRIRELFEAIRHAAVWIVGTGPTRIVQPTIFRLRHVTYSDRLLRAICVAGMVLALSVVIGLPQIGPSWLVAVVFLAMWALYMSIVNVGQTFYGFGWEILLLEAGFLAAWSGSATELVPQPLLLLTAWLLIRLEVGAGLIKWRGGSEWHDLTAMTYHHETQPMPGPLSRQAHLLPRWFHRSEVVANFVAQLAFPWLLFAPEPLASIGAFVIVGTQLWLIITGNYAWLNWITVVLALSTVSDPIYRWIFGLGTTPVPNPSVAGAWPWSLWGAGAGAGAAGSAPGALVPAPLWWQIAVWVVIVILVLKSWRPLLNLFSNDQMMNASFDRWQLVNAYGAFGTVTKRRIEVEIEGRAAAPSVAVEDGHDHDHDHDHRHGHDHDQDHDHGTATASGDWQAYGFRGKPGDLRRLSRQWAPYHLRLDWMMWFLPFGPVTREEWLVELIVKLLEADPATLRLLRVDPFDGKPPAAIRVRTYHYRFATRAERRQTGQRWVRTFVDEPVPPIRLARSGLVRA